MDTVRVVSNAALELHAIEPTKPRNSIYLVSIAASILPIFLACLSTLSCQQRHYIESKWGGVVVLSSILIYSFEKFPQTSADILRLQFGSGIESCCHLVYRKIFARPLFLHNSA